MSIFNWGSALYGTGYNTPSTRGSGTNLFSVSEEKQAQMRARRKTSKSTYWNMLYDFTSQHRSERLAKQNRDEGQQTEVSTVDDILLTQDKKKRQRGKKTNVTGGISARPTLFQGGLLS